jgi:putative Holliday junction resolvase
VSKGCAILFDRKRRRILSTKTSTDEERREDRREPGRILALDLGSKRVGVAVSDELRLTARALTTLRRTPWKRLLKDLRELCTEFDVRQLVLGLPLRLDDSEGDSALEVRRIARNLGISLKLPIVLQDERLTSKAAEASLREKGLDRRAAATCVDSESAAIFLRDYLARQTVELRRGPEGEN